MASLSTLSVKIVARTQNPLSSQDELTQSQVSTQLNKMLDKLFLSQM